jgi:phosphoglycerate kinase
MANTFLYAQGAEIGTSLAERDMADTARAILKKGQARNCTILLPVDAVVAAEFKPDPPVETVAANAVPKDRMILDVGPRTVAAIVAAMTACKTLVWNGPLGAFETPPFERATIAVAREAAALTRAGTLLSVAGGGDTVAALAAAGVEEQFSYVSTAGGAFLEWLEGKELPGVAALASR